MHRPVQKSKSGEDASLNDPEAASFFRQGDEGTYEGGPLAIDSLVPTGNSEPLGDDRPQLSSEQLARRQRLQRLVTTIVGTLGAVSAVAFSLRLASASGEPLSTPAASEKATAAAPSLPERAAPERSEAAPAVQVETATPADDSRASAGAPRAEVARAEVPNEPEPSGRRDVGAGSQEQKAARSPSAALEPRRHAATPRQSSAESYTRPSRPTIVRERPTPAGPTRTVAPPTANFPD